ncbi:hypothetical protein LJB99_05870 [Deltaproteobacteria bacterium OttesenSCG-928-K17]|nr:hypothetical protein [Deltaproteobacteria bacterium OttesenSCG-928-K17]
MDQKREIEDAVSHFHQPQDGYRFSADSILLADFVDISNRKNVADLGAGCGVVGLCALEKSSVHTTTNLRRSIAPLEHKSPQGLKTAPGPASAMMPRQGPERFYFIEREKTMLESLARNLALYQPRTSVRLVLMERDWRDLSPADFGGPLDYIMANPPYFPLKGSRPSRNPGRDAARREVHGGLADLVAAIGRLLAPDGLAALVLPPGRENDLRKALSENGLEIRSGQKAPAGKTPDLWLLGRSNYSAAAD